jgi:hypothetical protein
MMRSRIEGVKARGREGVSSVVPFTLYLSPYTKYSVNLRQMESNLKFTIHNLQFTMVFHHVPCTPTLILRLGKLHPVPSPPPSFFSWASCTLPHTSYETDRTKFKIHNSQFTIYNGLSPLPVNKDYKP